MKKLEKTIFSLALGGILAFSVAWGVSRVKAAQGDGYSPLAEKLATRFHLNKDEVQQVLNEERVARRQQRGGGLEDRLDQAVKDGKITADQKKAILEKREEMRAECERQSGLSWEERSKERAAHQEEMRKWAEENGLDLGAIPMFLGGGPKNGSGQFGKGR